MTGLASQSITPGGSRKAAPQVHLLAWDDQQDEEDAPLVCGKTRDDGHGHERPSTRDPALVTCPTCLRACPPREPHLTIFDFPTRAWW